MDKKEKTGVLNVRDLVNVGLFSVLIFIATFLSGMIGFIPVLMPVVPFVYGIVSGPVYMLYFTKIKKAGMLFIQTIVVTLAFVATGHGPWVLLTAVIGGLLGEVVLRNGRYKSVKHEVYKDNVPVNLTQLEFELLQTFLNHKNQVLTRDILIQQVWGYDFMGDEKTINIHIMNLRRKLDTDCIHTIRGVGYKFESEN